MCCWFTLFVLPLSFQLHIGIRLSFKYEKWIRSAFDYIHPLILAHRAFASGFCGGFLLKKSSNYYHIQSYISYWRPTSVCVGSSLFSSCLTCSLISKSDFLFFLGLADFETSVLLLSPATCADESSSLSSCSPSCCSFSSSGCGSSVFLALAAAAVGGWVWTSSWMFIVVCLKGSKLFPAFDKKKTFLLKL